MVVHRRCRLLISKSRKAFTLVEIMIVLAIVVIVTSVAIPSFKKARDNFAHFQNQENLTVLYTSMRSHYLVLNEFPEEEETTAIRKEAVWAIPSYYYKRTLKSGNSHELTINPSSDLPFVYHIDNSFSEENGTFTISTYWDNNNKNYSLEKWNKWCVSLECAFPFAFEKDEPKHISSLYYPEISVNYIGKECNDDDSYRNRFY